MTYIIACFICGFLLYKVSPQGSGGYRQSEERKYEFERTSMSIENKIKQESQDRRIYFDYERTRMQRMFEYLQEITMANYHLKSVLKDKQSPFHFEPTNIDSRYDKYQKECLLMKWEPLSFEDYKLLCSSGMMPINFSVADIPFIYDIHHEDSAKYAKGDMREILFNEFNQKHGLSHA